MSVGLTSRPLSPAAAYRELGASGGGGIVLFLGAVRADSVRGRRVVALDYEADRRMAIGALQRIAGEVERKFGARRVYAHHRVGRIPVGATSVIVGAAAAHRDAAFLAARELIERLKVEVPIWKRDVYARRGRPGSLPVK